MKDLDLGVLLTNFNPKDYDSVKTVRVLIFQLVTERAHVIGGEVVKPHHYRQACDQFGIDYETYRGAQI